MGCRRLIFGIWLLGALSTACAGTNGSTVLMASEPVSALSLAELQCFEGAIADPSDTRPMVVAMLSPRMVFSLLEWASMAREAQALGFRVRAWRDPRVPEPEWLLALSSEAFSKSGAPDPAPLPPDCMDQWSPIDHLPLTRVLREGHLHRWPIWGVMTPEAWRDSLLNRLETLQRASVSGGAY